MSDKKVFYNYLNLLFDTDDEIWVQASHKNPEKKDRVLKLTSSGFQPQRYVEATEGWVSNQYSPLSFDQVNDLALDGYDIFIKEGAPKGGLKLKFYNRSSKFITAEIDDLSLEEQRKIYQTLGIKPTVIIFTGGKSLHYKYQVNGCSVRDWELLSKQLTALVGGDAAVTRLSQPLRVPGFNRVYKGEIREVCIEEENNIFYSVSEFRNSLNDAWQHKYPFNEERFKLYINSRQKYKKGGDISPLEVPEDAFNVSDEVLFPKKALPFQPEYGQDKKSDGTSIIDYFHYLRECLYSLAPEWVYNEHGHNLKKVGSNKWVSGSPWSETNSSGTSFQVFNSGEFYAFSCKASSKGGSPVEYLQEVWYDTRVTRGEQFKLFVNRLAAKLNKLPYREWRIQQKDIESGFSVEDLAVLVGGLVEEEETKEETEDSSEVDISKINLVTPEVDYVSGEFQGYAEKYIFAFAGSIERAKAIAEIYNVRVLQYEKFDSKAILEVCKNNKVEDIRIIVEPGFIGSETLLKAYENQGKALELNSFKVSYLWYGQVDFNHVKIESVAIPSQVRNISFVELSRIARYRKQVQENKKIATILNQVTYPKTIINSRFIKGAIGLPEYGKVNAISSPTGTGKSVYNADVVAQWRRVYPKAPITFLGYRNGLLMQISKQIGMEMLIHLQDNEGMSLEEINRYPLLGLCTDSILKLDVEKRCVPGSLLFLDEVDAVLKHTLIGSTCAKKREEILIAFKNIIECTIKNGGTIVVSEENITDISLDFFSRVLGGREFINLTVNEFKKDPRNITVCSGDKSGLVNDVLLSLKKDEKVCITSDSVEFLKEVLKVSLEVVPTLKSLIVIQETGNDEDVLRFKSSPDRYISEEKPQLLLYSPAFESGGDMSDPYFDRMFFNFVNLEVRSLNQMIGRIRYQVPIKGCVSDKANDTLNKVFDPEKIFIEHQEMLDEELKRLLTKVYRTTGETLTPKQMIDELDPNSSNFPSVALDIKSKFMARRDIDRHALRERFIDYLKAKGDNVDTFEYEKVEIVKEEIKIAKEYILEEATKEFMEADITGMTKAKIEKILNSYSSQKSERIRAMKAQLLSNLPGLEVDFDMAEMFFCKNKARLYKKTRVFWELKHPMEAFRKSDEDLWSRLQKDFVDFFDFKTNGRRSEILNSLNLLEFAEFNGEWAEEDESIQNLKSSAVAIAKELKRYCGVTVNRAMSGLRILCSLLEIIGVKTSTVKRRTEEGLKTNRKIDQSEQWQYQQMILNAMDRYLEIKQNGEDEFSIAEEMSAEMLIRSTKRDIYTNKQRQVDQQDNGVTQRLLWNPLALSDIVKWQNQPHYVVGLTEEEALLVHCEGGRAFLVDRSQVYLELLRVVA